MIGENKSITMAEGAENFERGYRTPVRSREPLALESPSDCELPALNASYIVRKPFCFAFRIVTSLFFVIARRLRPKMLVDTTLLKKTRLKAPLFGS